MKNIKRLGKIALNLLGIVCVCLTFSGCPGADTLLFSIILQFLILNTILLIAAIVYLIWRFGFKK